ncbi:MAG: DVU0772 family protein, partial [Desulfocucumaceae bacterium]
DLLWDFKLGDEFKKNLEGQLAFIVDVYEKKPKLTLYRMKKNSSECNPIKNQPPEELLFAAIEKQGGKIIRNGMFNIDSEVEKWIKESLFKN